MGHVAAFPFSLKGKNDNTLILVLFCLQRTICYLLQTLGMLNKRNCGDFNMASPG